MKFYIDFGVVLSTKIVLLTGKGFATAAPSEIVLKIVLCQCLH
jgi:hypothetical protein